LLESLDLTKKIKFNFILGLAIIGMEWVSKVEVGLLGLLIIAQIDFVIGSFLPPTDQQMANGYIGYNNEQFKINLWSDYQVEENGEEYSFFKVQIF
jgi:solute carrier family 12 sodium/potassium/chloride transporter 2